MKLRIFKPSIAVVVLLLAAGSAGLAQAIPARPAAPVIDSVVAPVAVTDVEVNPEPVNTNVTVKVHLHHLKKQLKSLTAMANTQVISAVNNLSTEINADVADIAPQINMAFKDNEDVNVTVSTDKNDDDADKVKNYTKTYSANADDILSIENRYGNVTVNTWNRNEFKVDVQIKVSAGSDDAASKILDNVNVSDSKNGSMVSFRTNIEDVKKSWYSVFQSGESKKMEINYTVYMPAKNELVIDDRYGSIFLPDLDGKVTINSSYGSFKAKALTNQSTIRVKYGNASIESLGNCAMQLSYGELTIGSVDALIADVSYSPIKIGKLHTSAAINLRYGGGLQIGDLDRTVKNLDITSSYSNVDIGLSGDENADFAIVTHYGDFNYGGHAVTITGKDADDGEKGYHSTKSYKGYIGKGNSGKTIAINSNYGNVKFN
jgi:hypothetical protein